MGVGELGEVEVQSTYIHGQGLMVPVVGKLSLSMGEDGLPQHLLLVAEDQHTNSCCQERSLGCPRSLTLSPSGNPPGAPGRHPAGLNRVRQTLGPTPYS